MCDLTDLIGLRFELGADGSNGKIDCIHLCLIALSRMGIPRPAVNPGWYTMTRRQICRELLTWGVRISRPTYDGDIILFSKEAHTFGVSWQQGALYINSLSQAVQWCPHGCLPESHYFRGKGS